MTAMVGFFRTMLTLPKPWVAWVMLLMTVTMIIPLFYLGTWEAKAERAERSGRHSAVSRAVA